MKVYKTEKPVKHLFYRLLVCFDVLKSEAGGNRTLVQTSNPCAFYILIPILIFVNSMVKDDLAVSYLLLFRVGRAAKPKLA